VTARVTTLKGPTAGLYYVHDLPRYYLGADEPPGRWAGRGAAQAGLIGEVDPSVFVALVDGLDPSGTIVRGRRYGERSVRSYDITCSAPKSVSVLWAVADEPIRREVLDAHDTAVAAVIDFVDGQAHTRPVIDGHVVVVDAKGITAATFRQHTSRALDPQLHTHAIVIAKVQAPHGRWLALDGRVLKHDQRTLSALYHAALRGELTRRLGVSWRPVANGISELDTVPPSVLEAFSTRTAQYERRVAVKLDRFVKTMDRPPTPRERYRLERGAAADSRPPKSRAVEPAQLHARWRRELGDLGVDRVRLVKDSLGRPGVSRLGPTGVRAMVDQALAALADQQSTWRRNELIRELARAVPTTVAVGAHQLSAWLDSVAESVIGRQLIEYAPPAYPLTPRRQDGRPITESPLDRRFTTPAIVAQERAILGAVDRRLRLRGVAAQVDADGLDRAQLEVASAVAGTAQLVLVVGPAGTGKTTALRPAVAALRRAGRRVYGLAPSANAASVLADETGMPADTVDKLLHGRRNRRARLPAATTLVVDEAGMLATPKLAELLRIADEARCRLVLVGDPLQLSAVGRGGMFAFLTGSCPVVTLDRVHRFQNAWEREASLALRAGHSEGLAPYERHGRLHVGTDRQIDDDVVERWTSTRSSADVAVLCATNKGARRLNRLIQAQRLATGELQTARTRRLASGEILHVGDLVVTRRNERTLRTDAGVMVKNRARWTVRAIGEDGGLLLAGADGTVRLPAVYVARTVDLGYAQTIHAAQGRTVDHSILVVDGPIDGRAVYVGLTRGRQSNDAFVVTNGDRSARDVLGDALARSWVDRPAIELEQELRVQQVEERLRRLESRAREPLGRSL
jgi:conjugative relaxase-like TrwC/TraI family protein